MFVFIRAGWNVRVCKDIHRFLCGMKIHSAAIEGYYCHLLSPRDGACRAFYRASQCKRANPPLMHYWLKHFETKIELECSEQHRSKSLGQYIHLHSVTDRNASFTSSKELSQFLQWPHKMCKSQSTHCRFLFRIKFIVNCQILLISMISYKYIVVVFFLTASQCTSNLI